MKVTCSECGKQLIKDIWAHLDFHDQDTLYSYCPSCLDTLLKNVRVKQETLRPNCLEVAETR